MVSDWQPTLFSTTPKPLHVSLGAMSCHHSRFCPLRNLNHILRSTIHLYACMVCRSVMSDSFVAPWTVACQAPLWNFPGKNIGVGCHFLLQGIILTQGLNPCLLCLLYWQRDFFTTEPLRSHSHICLPIHFRAS